MQFSDIFQEVARGHPRSGGDLDETRIRGYAEREAKLETGHAVYRTGRSPHLWAQDYRTMPANDTVDTLPLPLTKVDVLKPQGEQNVIVYAHNSVIDELRPKLLAASPKVYREITGCYTDQMHSRVVTLSPYEIAGLILAMYCDPRMHIR